MANCFQDFYDFQRIEPSKDLIRGFESTGIQLADNFFKKLKVQGLLPI